MAKRHPSNLSAGQHNRRYPSRKSNNSWKYIVAGLLVVVAVFGIMAYRSAHSGHEAETAASSGNQSQPTFQNLELTRYSNPGSAKKAITKNYNGFTISYNPDNKTPDWVGWELLASETDGPAPRAKKFWADPEIENSPYPDDYRNSGYDKGHMCPAADQKWSFDAMNDCFVMTNMTPQTHALNAGAWNTLENKERIWAQRDSALIIVAGPIYAETDKERIGPNGVRVPSAFFKVLLAPYVKNPRAIGFVYPNMKAPGNMQNYSMSVDEVEKLTGLDFFSSLPDDLEEKIESRYSFTEWNRR